MGRPSSVRTFLGLEKLEKCTPRLAERLDKEMLPPGAIWSSYQSRIARFFRCKQRAIGVAVYLFLFNCKEDDSVSLVFEQA